MKPARFEYQAPADLEAAIALLGEAGGGAKVIAGGQSLGPMLNLRLAMPAMIVDIGGIGELVQTVDGDRSVTLGACVTHAAVEDGAVPDPSRGMMPHVAGDLASRAVRNRGTVGGTLAHADPAADWITTLTALDARLHLRGRGGARTVPLEAFMVGAFATVLSTDEILASVEIDRLSGSARWAYYKICRKVGTFADAIGAVVADPERSFHRVVMGAVDSTPVRLRDLEEALAAGQRDDAVRLAAGSVAAARPDFDAVDVRLHGAAVGRAIREV